MTTIKITPAIVEKHGLTPKEYDRGSRVCGRVMGYCSYSVGFTNRWLLLLGLCAFVSVSGSGCHRTPEERLEKASNKHTSALTEAGKARQLNIIQGLAQSESDSDVGQEALLFLVSFGEADEVLETVDKALSVSRSIPDKRSRSIFRNDVGSMLLSRAFEEQSESFLNRSIRLTEDYGIDLRPDPMFILRLNRYEKDSVRNRKIDFMSGALARLLELDLYADLPEVYWYAHLLCLKRTDSTNRDDCDGLRIRFQEWLDLKDPDTDALMIEFYSFLRGLDEDRPVKHPEFGDVTRENYDAYMDFELESWFGSDWRSVVLDENGYPRHPIDFEHMLMERQFERFMNELEEVQPTP